MSVITIPASRTTTDSEMKDIGRLAAELRAHFAAVQPEDVNLAIAEALGAVSVALGVESCRLIEFTDNGTVARVHAPAGTSTTVIGRHRPPAPDDWLVTRLSRGQIVVISRPEELPTEAVAAREAARRTMGYSILGVPAPIAGPTCSPVSSSLPPFIEYNKHLARFARAPKNCICLPTSIGETQHAIAPSSPHALRMISSLSN